MSGGWLAGMKCPRCNHKESFHIEVTGFVTVLHDNGYDPARMMSSDWNPKSGCKCINCGMSGRVSDFMGHSSVAGESDCPSCGNETVVRHEVCPVKVYLSDTGEVAVDNEYCYDEQIATGLYSCPDCGHVWGILNDDLLPKMVQFDWAIKREPKSGSIWRRIALYQDSKRAACEALIEIFKQDGSGIDNDEMADVLCEIYEATKREQPSNEKAVLKMVDSLFSPGSPNRGIFTFLSENIRSAIERKMNGS